MARRLRRRLAGFRRRLAGHETDRGRRGRGRRSGIRHQPRPAHADAPDFGSRRTSPPKRAQQLQESLVLVHGGMAQNVGPILEMVTEKYLLRSDAEWTGAPAGHRHPGRNSGRAARAATCGTLGGLTTRNFSRADPDHHSVGQQRFTPKRSSPRVRAEFGADFWGFWMLGGMSGGGMGFIFDPARKAEAQERLQEIMSQTKRELQHALPFAMEPVVYDFAINERGTWADLLPRRRRAAAARLLRAASCRNWLGWIRSRCRRRAARNWTSSAPPAAPGRNWAAWCRTLFDRLLPRLKARERPAAKPGANCLSKMASTACSTSRSAPI